MDDLAGPLWSPSGPDQESEVATPDHMDTQSRALPMPSSSTDMTILEALDLTMRTLELVLRRTYDRNVLPHVHIMLLLFVILASHLLIQAKGDT